MSTTAITTQIDWERIARAELNPIRTRVLEAFALAEEPISPSMLAKDLDERLGNVSYHVRTLLDQELIKLVDTQPRRGAVEHYYELVDGVLIDG